VAIGSEEQLIYRYDEGGGAQAWIAAEHLIPAGNDWQRAARVPAPNTTDVLGATG